MKRLASPKNIRTHLLCLVAFLILSVAYVSPVLEGKRLWGNDIVQAKAGAHELDTYHEKTGKWALWTNSMFGGMPAFMVAADHPSSLSTKLGRLVYKMLPVPACLFFLSLVSAYLLLWVLTASAGVAFTGAIAFTFATFSLISIEAGHISKVMAIGYAPGILAGVMIAFRKNWLTGAAITSLFLALELYANHVQITYYIGIAIIIYAVMEGVVLIKSGQSRKLGLIAASMFLAVVIALGTHTSRLWSAYDYSKATIRGESELTPVKGKSEAPRKGGLDKDYAFQWSYGIGETINLLIPNAFGGSSSQNQLDDKSETYKMLVSRGVDAGNARGFVTTLPVPLYWGDQPGTGGPAYVGAIVFFLFVLGLFIVKGRIKWWLAGSVLLYIIWAWGKNFESLNFLFFDYFPMFNKFRAVTMTLAFAQLFMVVLGFLALSEMVHRKYSWGQLKKPFGLSLLLSGGLALLLGLAPALFFSFRGPYDADLVDNLAQSINDRSFAEEIVKAIGRDRAGIFRIDAFRSFFFIAVTALLLWLWMREKIRPVMLFLSLAMLVITDMFSVGKRYLSNADFITKEQAEAVFKPTAADQLIMQDPDPHFRVLDLTRSPFQSAEASYFHKSIGGYHGAKLRRYQELFERQIAKPNANPGILNMLNAKYTIFTDQNKAPVPQPNPEALGNAWFVNSYELVPGADAEMAALDSLKPREKAVLDQRFASALDGLSIRTDSTDGIKLVSYAPDELVYESHAQSEQLAVFSEIYYNVRNEWKVTIDDQPATLLRANYVLRALRVPAGKHTIRFSFEPLSVTAGNKIDLVSSLLLAGLLLGAAVMGFRNRAQQS